MSRSRAGNARDVKNISFHSRTAAALHAVKGDGEGDEANTELLLNGDVGRRSPKMARLTD